MTTQWTRIGIFCGLLCAFLALAGAPASAQTGALSGKVVDENDEPIGGFTLVLTPQDQAATLSQKLKVNKKGRFAHRFIPTARYAISLEDSDAFLESMVYTIRDSTNLQVDQQEAKAHPEKGLPAIKVLTGQNGTLELKVASADYRQKLSQQVAISESSGDLQRASELLNAGKAEECLTLSNEIIEKKPDLGAGYYLRGAALYRLKRYAEAEADLRKAAEMIPDQAGVHSTLGDTLLQQADALRRDEATAEEAKAVFSEAADLYVIELGKDPNAEYVVRNQVVALKMAERREEWKTALEHLVEIVPQEGEAYLVLAELAAQDGDPDAALEWIERSPDKGASTVTTLFNIAVNLYNESKYDESEPLLNKALEIDPEFPELHRLQAGILLVRGDRPGAIVGLKRFLELAGPEAAGTEQSRQLLAALEAAEGSANQ